MRHIFTPVDCYFLFPRGMQSLQEQTTMKSKVPMVLARAFHGSTF